MIIASMRDPTPQQRFGEFNLTRAVLAENPPNTLSWRASGICRPRKVVIAVALSRVGFVPPWTFGSFGCHASGDAVGIQRAGARDPPNVRQCTGQPHREGALDVGGRPEAETP